MKTRLVILMGVAGSGKTTVGQALARRLGWAFYDADDYHPPENIEKMADGTPLTDADRLPWLAALHTLISTCLHEDRPAVLACSALKERYRRQLLDGRQDVALVYLKGSFGLIWSRLARREGHYMKPPMLRSQFEDLEEPSGAIQIDAALPVDEVVEEVVNRMQ